MAIDVPAPVAGVGGGLMLAGGGALVVAGQRQMVAATKLSQFGTPSQVVPALQELRSTLGTFNDMLGGVQSAMSGTRLPLKGAFSKMPFIGGMADDLERAARLGAGAKELAKIDERATVEAMRTLTQRADSMAAAAQADVTQLAVAKANSMSAGTKLLIGGAIAAAGALLLATTIFDVE